MDDLRSHNVSGGPTSTLLTQPEAGKRNGVTDFNLLCQNPLEHQLDKGQLAWGNLYLPRFPVCYLSIITDDMNWAAAVTLL